jgi:phosphoglycerate dehydrogenase-like enzyme
MIAGRPNLITRPKILLHSDRPEKFEPRIRERFPQIAVASCCTYADVSSVLKAQQPNIVLSHKFESRPYPGRELVDAPSVRWIHAGGTGVDHFIPWPRERLTITNSAGAPKVAIAEYVMGAIYALNHHLPDCFRAQSESKWIPRSIRVTDGNIITVIGLGRIGRTICSKAKAAGLKVLGVRTHPDSVPDVDEIYLPDRMKIALAQADYVVVIVPLTKSTINLLDDVAISSMKPGALLINVSRGGIVNETCLLAALRSGHLRGAVLDVFEREPLPADNPLWRLDNVIVTPHMAGFFEGWEKPTLEIFCENLERWLSGRSLINEVDPDVGYCNV